MLIEREREDELVYSNLRTDRRTPVKFLTSHHHPPVVAKNVLQEKPSTITDCSKTI